MGDLSDHFSRSEFACKCGCGFDTVDTALLTILVRLRKYFDRPVSINSACRCHEHNEEIQKAVNPNYIEGSSKSQHLRARAADVVVEGTSPSLVANTLERWYQGNHGVGRYNTFTHIDSRTEKARWDYSSKG